ncbi:MAG: hypothetical protein AVO39_11600, partial [delta proteobacterium MLS_D]
KNGLVVDGTGKMAFAGNVLIRGDRIEEVSPRSIETDAPVMDCTGLVVMPGIIDAHSHMDWIMPVPGREDLKLPYTAQGVTTFVAGQCGYGIAGIRKNTPFMARIESRIRDMYRITWRTMAEYFDHIQREGMTHNLVNLAGHGTTRTSIRDFDASPPDPGEMKEMLALLEQAMDEGAAGVSLGLQYEPGIFAGGDELRAIASLVKRKGKVLSVHMRAYSALSPGYSVNTARVLLDYVFPFDGYTPHNLLAIDEMIDVARETGVRLQLSHLIFAGTRTFKTCGKALERIDNAIQEGVDVRFDTYAYHCGQSFINVVLPAWFLADVPRAYDDPAMLSRLKREFALIERFLGFGTGNIQITHANHDELNRYDGLFIDEIAGKRGMTPFDVAVEIAKKSGGLAAVLNHGYSNEPIVEELMRHSASIFMTDAIPAPEGIQNPALSGNYPRFLQWARDRKIIALEEAARKMSGAVAERYGIRDRGFLKAGLAADIAVIDWNNIRDNNTIKETANQPSGVEAVFINGRRVLDKGRIDKSARPGRVIPL